MIKPIHPFIASIVLHLITVNIPSYPFSLSQSSCAFSPSILQTTVACVWDRQQWMNVEFFLLITSGGWQSLASLHASLGSIQLRFALCRSGHCWILIPPSNIRPIDFFPEGCFCLHNYWIDFKQRGSSICPRVIVNFFLFLFFERNNTKNRPILSVVVFLVYARALQH